VIDQEWVQLALAKVHAKLEFLKLINWKVAWAATENRLDVADASTVKVFGTEFYLEAFRLIFEVVGQRGYLTPNSEDSVLNGRLERLYRSLLILTFGGGTNEIQRDLIAMFGLGLPRSLRSPTPARRPKEPSNVDFSFSEDQQAMGDLARRILEDQVTQERLKEVEADQDRIDRRTWSQLARANLLGVALPEDAGGSGLGFLSACILLYEVGRTVPGPGAGHGRDGRPTRRRVGLGHPEAAAAACGHRRRIDPHRGSGRARNRSAAPEHDGHRPRRRMAVGRRQDLRARRAGRRLLPRAGEDR
jgi:Acyl-CoA dehydrogenase, C-terminal domain/Acyl-CoA dehydrogenase, N-terminal domain